MLDALGVLCVEFEDHARGMMGADKRDTEECVTPSCVAPAVFSILEGAITAW